MSYPVLVLAFAGPLLGSAVPADEASASSVSQGRWTTVSLAAELREKDTDRIDIVTAGEEQQSSYGRCSKATDPDFCRVIVSAINAAAIIGSAVTGQ